MKKSQNQVLWCATRISKIWMVELKKCLYALFSQYGQIIDLVAIKTKPTRGQAFIVYKEVISAANAMRSLQSYPFFGKPMVLYASCH